MKNLFKKVTAFGFCALFAFLISGCDLFISVNFTKAQYAQAIGNVTNTIDVLASDSAEQSRTLSMFYDDSTDIFKTTEFND
ncbi:MAG: hypothetical protein PHX09_04330, partial [Clostridia bacterium]|nr:hypothetical protein [Clostridia bacterium]